MNTKSICGVGLALSLLLLLPVGAHAAQVDPILITFDTPLLSGIPGDVLTYRGTITNTSGANLYITSAAVALDSSLGDAVDYVDLTPFVMNFTLDDALTAGDSIGVADFFTLTIPDSFVSGSYDGTLTVLGGPDGGDNLGSASFQFNVQDAGQSVPEPGTLGLTALSIGALALRFRRRRTA